MILTGELTWDTTSMLLSAYPFIAEAKGVADSTAYILIEGEAPGTVKLPGDVKVWLYSSTERIPLTLLFDLQNERYELKQPLPLQQQMYQGYFLVSDTLIYRHGLGVSIEEAILDYEDDIVDYFESLRRNRQNLSPDLEADLEQLEQLIRER